MSESERRQEFVAIARSWIGTPYHLNARVKGAGVDCATLIAECLVEAGLAEREDLGVYSHDWFAHTERDRYMLRLLRHAEKTLEGIALRSHKILPGCILLTKAADSRVWNHGAIVTAYPLAIHAIDPRVAECDVSLHPMWAFQQMLVMDPILK